MPRRLTAVLSAAILLVAFAVPAQAADRARAEHDRILAYWTPERMASAIPRDFVRSRAGTSSRVPSRTTPAVAEAVAAGM